MTNIAKSIATVQQAFDAIGGKELSRRADVPYTTLLGWAAKGFKPGAIDVLERLEAAAVAVESVPDGVMAAPVAAHANGVQRAQPMGLTAVDKPASDSSHLTHFSRCGTGGAA